jgi:RNA polymerase sigma-70 factor (ECF subfamily)
MFPKAKTDPPPLRGSRSGRSVYNSLTWRPFRGIPVKPGGAVPNRDRATDPPDARLSTTAELLSQARSGDATARDRLVRRFLPALSRWAHGRLPRGARDLTDTDDLVQVALLKALDHLEGFDPRHPGAFLGYLRSIVLNCIRDEARRVERSPVRAEVSESMVHPSASPLEETIGRETLVRYERALGALTGEQREAVVLRVELGFTYAEIAAATGSPTANAARMLVARALVRLGELLGGDRRAM